MKLFINEKNNWTKDEFEILDEKGKLCYTVEGDGLKQESKLHIYDIEKNEIGIIRKEYVGFSSEFYVEIYDQLFGTIEPTMSIFRNKFDVDLFGWNVKSNWWGNRYSIYKDNNLIASFKYTLNGSNANYEVNILNPEDEMPMILLVLTIYMINAHKLTRCAVYQ